MMRRRHMRGMLLIAFAAVLTLTAGSTGGLEGGKGDKESADSIPLIMSKGITQLVAKNAGKIVILNFWATWCSPCVKELPGFLELRTKYGDRGLELILVSLDAADGLETNVKPFLKKLGVDFLTYIKNPDEPVTPFIDAIDPDWSGAIPQTYIYDRQGTRIAAHVGYMERTELEQYIKQSL